MEQAVVPAVACLPHLQATNISGGCNTTIDNYFICETQSVLFPKNTLILKYAVLMIRNKVN